MKKAVILFFAVIFTAFLGGCSAGETQNNISRAIDNAAGVVDDGINKFENGTYNDITKNSRGWENGYSCPLYCCERREGRPRGSCP